MTEALAGARRDLAAAREAATEERRGIDAERLARRQELAELERAVRETEATLEAAAASERQLRSALAEAEREAADRAARLEHGWRTLRENRKEAEAAFLRAGPDRPDLSAVDRLLEAESGAARHQAAAEGLVTVYREHFEAVSRAVSQETAMVLPSGDRQPGRLLRLGALGGVGVVDALGVGVVTVAPGGGEWQFSPLRRGSAEEGRLAAALGGGDGVMPVVLEVSDGRGLMRLGQARTWGAFARAGGPVMVPLALVAVLAMLMVAERAVYLMRVDANVDRVMGTVAPLVGAGAMEEALAQVRAGAGPVRRVLQAGLEQARRSTDNLEEILQEAILAELPLLERWLGALAVFAAIAPLLGLLGTVSGMIGTFRVIELYGTGNARMLSGGISEALITTQVGLVVAVPILLAHAWLNREVRLIVGHIDRAAIALTGAIREAVADGGGRAGGDDDGDGTGAA